MATFGGLIESLLPEAADRVLEKALGSTLPRDARDGRYRIFLAGRFDGRFAAELLTFAQNHVKDGALVLGDADCVRVLYFRRGAVIGADSDVIFERLGRTLLRSGAVTPEEAASVTEMEETVGIRVASGLLAPDVLRTGLEQRTREIATSMPFLHGGHFLLVMGMPDLGDLPLLSIGVMDLVLEGVRRYDEWRYGRESSATAASPSPAGARPENGVSAGRPKDTPAPPVHSARRAPATAAVRARR